MSKRKIASKTLQVPTALADWTPETGWLGTKFSRPLISSDSIYDSFRKAINSRILFPNAIFMQNSVDNLAWSKLTEELDEVMEDTLEIVEFNACNVKEKFSNPMVISMI